jgi:hypothetical protein
MAVSQAADYIQFGGVLQVVAGAKVRTSLGVGFPRTGDTALEGCDFLYADVGHWP